jgi:hypothetical protein
MTYSAMASTTFNEKTYISKVLKAIYYEYTMSIDKIITHFYMLEFGNDVEKKQATLEAYHKAGELKTKTLYSILYFKINKAIDTGEELEAIHLESGYVECDDCDECEV